MEKNEQLNIVYNVGDCIFSPLGYTSEENYENVLKETSALKLNENIFNIPEPSFSSIIDRNIINNSFEKLKNDDNEKYTYLEKIAIISVYEALKQTKLDPSSDEVIFIFSTTKGNVELLENNNDYEPERVYLWKSAKLIAEFFGNKNKPMVVSNACISGVAAILLAKDYLQFNQFKHAIVVGAEMLSKFIISGFQSFKALSPMQCKPFDKNRIGLNLGEAAATMILSTDKNMTFKTNITTISAGAICNDANHISGPSRTAEGLTNAINNTLLNNDNKISFINAHGTATIYNDDMESVAINRAKLNDIKVNSLKAYFGHTLGAAGILETIISIYALNNNTIIKSLGYSQLGTVENINVCSKTAKIESVSFLKLISGFGGSNAALLVTKQTK